MKKVYIVPETELLDIVEQSELLQASLSVNEEEVSSGILSRDMIFDDVEE